MKLTSLLVGLFFAVALAASAEGEKKPNPQTQELLERARKAKEEGRYDEAKKLAEQLREQGGFEKHGRPDARHGGEKAEKLHHMKAEIEELHRAGKQEEANKLRDKFESELRSEHKDFKGEHKEPRHDVGGGDERLGHLMEAIKHLRAAKINEPAEGLEHMAAQMREELERQKHASGEKHAGGEKHPMMKPGPEDHELQELRGQMKQMAHAIEEMRGELNRLRGDEVRKPEKK
jgi:TolA-binding protein